MLKTRTNPLPSKRDGNMRKKHIFAAIILFIVAASYVGVIIHVITNDPMNDLYKDRIEYPLKSVDVSDDSEYMLVKWQHSPVETYEIITDTQIIKENVSAFYVDNDGLIYATTPDGLFYLYKDGKLIDSISFDGTYTRKIEYGTLKFQKMEKSAITCCIQ